MTTLSYVVQNIKIIIHSNNMTFAEFRQNLFKLRAEIESYTIFTDHICKVYFKGVAVSRSTWNSMHPEAVAYVVLFNLPSLTTASRNIFIDNVQIFLVDEPDAFYPVLELPNLTTHYTNGPNKQREMA